MTPQEIATRLEKFYAEGGKDVDLAVAFMLEGVPELLKLAEAGRKLREAMRELADTDYDGLDHVFMEAVAAYDEAVKKE